MSCETVSDLPKVEKKAKAKAGKASIEARLQTTSRLKVRGAGKKAGAPGRVHLAVADVLGAAAGDGFSPGRAGRVGQPRSRHL